MQTVAVRIQFGLSDFHEERLILERSAVDRQRPANWKLGKF